MKSFIEKSLTKSPYFKDIQYFITNFDLQSAFPNCKIVKYTDLEIYEFRLYPEIYE